MSERESPLSLADLRARRNQDFDGEVHLTNEELDALTDAVEAAQAAWRWIDAVARSVDDHQLAHGARVARQALSLKLVLFEESVSEYGR